MTAGNEAMSGARALGWVRPAAAAAGETLLAMAALFATDALAHRKLSVAGFVLLTAGWVVTHLVAASWRHRKNAAGWAAGAVELSLPALWLAGANIFLKQPWTAPQIAHAVGLVFCLWWVWRRLAREPAETARLLMVGAVAFAVTGPFFTDLQLGGRDARWYTSVFIDFLQQLRAGVFPVFLGQGELSYNGSANLFRSAPLCLWLGGLWDWATWQALSPIAIRNLSVITVALGAGYSMYAALITLGRNDAPRWLAALCAALYLLCPAMLLSLYFYELQMTWTALIALPWVFHGNVQAMKDPAGRGYIPLAVGLTLVWLAHAPLAIISTLATAAFQLGYFAFVPGAWTAKWRAAAAGAGWFFLLSAYYFLGMSELPASGEGSLTREAGFMIGVVLVVVGAVQGMLREHRTWLAGLAAGIALLAWLAPAWLAWALTWIVLWGLVCLGLRCRVQTVSEAPAILLATVTMLAAAAIAQVWARGQGLVPDDLMMRELSNVTAARLDLLRPVSTDLGRYGSVQPGYAIWVLIGVTLIGAFWSRRTVPALLGSVLLLLLALSASLPWAAEFVVGFAPVQVGHAMNFPMLYRLVPVMAVIGLFGGFLVLKQAGELVRRWFVLGLAVGLLWSAAQAWLVVRAGFGAVKTRQATGQVFHPDSYALGRYPYNLLFTPLHYMDGKQMPWMESRLLTPHYDLLVGPEQLARQAEAIQVQSHPLTSREDDTYPQWRRFTPDCEVQPGETLLLRFEFDPRFNPSGWLILGSENGYQEHLLDPTYGGAGFGAGPIASRVLAVTNTGPRTEHYKMTMKTEPGNTLPRDGGTWGHVHISRYYPDKAPVKIESLVPYRAQVTISEDGFLETPRQWIAGYRAWVDGQRVATERMKSGMLGLPLNAGTHSVVIEFAGSRRLWLGLMLSTGAMLVLIWRHTLTWRADLRRELHSWIETNRT